MKTTVRLLVWIINGIMTVVHLWTSDYIWLSLPICQWELLKYTCKHSCNDASSQKSCTLDVLC